MTDPTSDPRPDELARRLAQLTPEERLVLDRIIHVLAAEGLWPAPAVVRADRVEVVDPEGRVRLVLGDVGPGEPGYLAGVSLRDTSGSERAGLLLHDSGPELAMAFEGDDALVMGVHDAGAEAEPPGPYLQLLDRSGHAAVGWRVTEQGLEIVGAAG